MKLQDHIRKLLIEKIKEGDDLGAFSDEDDLFAKGILSSLEILDLVVTLEDTFAVKIPHYEVIEKYFCSLDAMAAYLQSKGVPAAGA